MANISITRDTKANIDAMPITDGRIYFTTDQTYNHIYTDVGTNRIQIGGTTNVGDSSANTVTFSESPTLVNIASGETHATMFGKIKKLFTDMIVVKNKLSTVGTIINATSMTSGRTIGGQTASYLGYIDLDPGTYIVEGVGHVTTSQDCTVSLSESVNGTATDASHEASFHIPSWGGAVSYTGIISVTVTTRLYLVVWLQIESVCQGRCLKATKLN